MWLATPATARAAQPPEEEPGAGEEPEGKGEPKGEPKEPEGEPPPPEGDKPQPGEWGVGGTEQEGRFGPPKKKKGKVEELDEKAEKDRERAEGPPELPPPGFAYLDTAFGIGELVIPAQPTGGTSIEPTVSFLISVGYRIGDTWQIYARFPISTGINDGPRDPAFEGGRNPDKYTQIATGALELGAKPHFIINRDLRVPVQLSVTFPTAAGDMFADVDNRAELGQAIVNAAAAASRGWYDRALFAHKRFGIIPGAGVLFNPRVGPGKMDIGGETKVEIMIRTGGNDPPCTQDLADQNAPVCDSSGDGIADQSEIGSVRRVAVSWLLGGHFIYDFFDGLLGVGTRLWFTVSNAPDVKGTIDSGGWQPVIEIPYIRTHIPFTEQKNVGLDAHASAVLPMGLELGGGNPYSSKIFGFHVGAGLFFGP